MDAEILCKKRLSWAEQKRSISENLELVMSTVTDNKYYTGKSATIMDELNRTSICNCHDTN